MKRFSKQQLFRIRNNININLLISDILKIPSKTGRGGFQFLCPLCSGFNTGTMLKNNLARCYQCEVNSNTIEMVMNVKKVDFVASATFLQQYLDMVEGSAINTSGNQSASNNVLHNSSSMHIQQRSLNEQTKIMTRELSSSSSDLLYSSEQNTETESLLQLEKKVNDLSKQFDQLKAFVISEFCKKSKNII